MIASRSCLVAVVALAVTHTSQGGEVCPKAEKVATALADLAMAVEQADRKEGARRSGAARSPAGKLQSAAKESRSALRRVELATLRKSAAVLGRPNQERPLRVQDAGVAAAAAMDEKPFVASSTLSA